MTIKYSEKEFVQGCCLFKSKSKPYLISNQLQSFQLQTYSKTG